MFTNVTSPSTKAKLRLLFEVAPLGLLIENAGGFSSDGSISVLDKPITNTDVRTQVRGIGGGQGGEGMVRADRCERVE